MEALLRAIEPGHGRVILVVTAHADDAALFLGGTIAAWCDAGWRVVVVRATDDRWDSVGLDEATTTDINAREFRRAADVLGISEIVELGLPTDTLGDVGKVALREQIIRVVRTYRPYALVSFDPDAMFGEDNLDHIVVARATDEAFWTSQFDLHHPQHFADGLEPHGCFERWYFGRRVIEVTDVVDITDTLDRKVAAACCHHTMMRNFFNQLRLQARTGGWDLPVVEQALIDDDIDGLLARFVRADGERTGARHGLTVPVEQFRVVTFGGMGTLLDEFGVRR